MIARPPEGCEGCCAHCPGPTPPSPEPKGSFLQWSRVLRAEGSQGAPPLALPLLGTAHNPRHVDTGVERPGPLTQDLSKGSLQLQSWQRP